MVDETDINDENTNEETPTTKKKRSSKKGKASVDTTQTTTDEPSTEATDTVSEDTTVEPATEQPQSESESTVVSDPVKPIVNTFSEYAQAMKPGTPVTIQDITRWQMRLRNAVNTMLKIDARYFSEAMLAVIGIIRENRDGAFSPRMLYRGHPQLRVSSSELTALQSVLNLLTTSADYNNPRDINDMVDLNVVFGHLNDDEAQNKLTSFYQL